MRNMRNNSVPVYYIGLVCELHNDIASRYVDTETILIERQYIVNRAKTEGFDFLTKVLPSLGKAVDKALATNTRLAVAGFPSREICSVVPKFLGYLLDRVFDSEGWELCNSDPVALKHLRQLVYLLYKLEIPYDQETERSSLAAFVKTDQDLSSHEEAFDWNCDWIVHAREVVTRVVSGLDPYQIKPGHGPGAVATGESMIEKTKFSRIYRSLETCYPFTEWMMWNLNHVADSLPRSVANTHWVVSDLRRCQYLDHLDECDEPSAKVVLVPKDSRGPRLISCEPLEIQWIQQGLKDILQKRIETSHWSKGQVNFTSQEVNRRLALLGSTGREWVTLDMKDASDRVSLRLVETLFAGHPELLKALKACRSPVTMLPDGTAVRLKKFAPMGSAVCFPVESLVFWALAVSAIHMNRRISWRQARKAVFVYGDDIICNTQDYECLLQQLPKVGLMFNQDKCCVGRFFRESCGCDAYKGIDITPVKLKTPWSHRLSADTLVSYTALHNAMLGLGYEGTAEYTRYHLESVSGLLPGTWCYERASNGAFIAQSGGPALVCWERPYQYNEDRGLKSRVNRKDYPEPVREYLTWVVVPETERTKYDGYAEMLRRYSAGWRTSNRGTYTLARRSSLKRAWVAI